VAVMGCVVNGPGESKHSNIGISLPGSGERPVAPVFVDGEKTVTLKGDNIADEFKKIVDDYVRSRYGADRSGAQRAPFRPRPRSRPQPKHEREHEPYFTSSPRMNDILPDEAALWEELEETLRSWLQSYGYRNLRTPLLEPTTLFRRAIGEATDIVEKEMYSFVDELNGEALTLRPEATASTVRAAIQHNLLYGSPQRLYYLGPMYRHERPQKGRYRQFHQVGAEALATPARMWMPNCC